PPPARPGGPRGPPHPAVGGTGGPSVPGQPGASAIVTGRARCPADPAAAPLGAPSADPATGAEPATVLAGPPLQPKRTALIPAARAVAAIVLRDMGRSFRGALLQLHRHPAAGSRAVRRPRLPGPRRHRRPGRLPDAAR